MAASTPRGINYPTSDDKIKDGTSPSALADDFAGVATSSDAAITAAVQEAKDDATTKYGGLPQRVTNVEQKNILQDEAIEAAEIDKGTMPSGSNANTFEESGLWYTGGVGTIETHTNLAVQLPSQFFVLAGFAPYSVSQIQIPSSANETNLYYRTKTSSADWSPWKVSNFDLGTMPQGTDANTLRKPGQYYTGGAGTPVNSLTNVAVNFPSSFLVLGSGGTVAAQIQIPYGSEFAMYYRATASSTTWHSWKKIPLDFSPFQQGTMSAETNMNDFYEIGNHYTGGSGVFETHTNLAVSAPSTVLVVGSGSAFSTAQIQIPHTSDAVGYYYRAKVSSTIWSPWVNLATGGGGNPSGSAVNWTATPASHEMRVQAFKDAYPLVSTGNKGVVCFRNDHGIKNFKEVLLPLFQANGITPYIAMNSRNWDDAENSGVTIAEAAAWANVEWGNHTADHRDRNTAEGIYDNIVNGRKELEAQLGRTIHGFTVPGLSEYNKFEGFAAGNLDNYSETLAGGLILANHAICSGSIGSAQRPLDGEVRQGGRHYTWEAQTFANIKAQVDSAVANKTALTLMCHPRTMNLSGYWTPALAQQVIEYVKSLIDAGQLANISYYQSHHATL